MRRNGWFFSLLLGVAVVLFSVPPSQARVVEWKAPEVTVKLDLPKGYDFKLVYSRKVFISFPSKGVQIVSRVLPSMVITPEDIRREGGHHHHEPVGTKELAKRLVGTAKAMNGRSASGRKVEVIGTRLGEKGKGIWFGEEIYTITDEERNYKALFCQRIYYSPKFTLTLFLEKRLKKGEDEKAIYRAFQKIADSVSF